MAQRLKGLKAAIKFLARRFLGGPDKQCFFIPLPDLLLPADRGEMPAYSHSIVYSEYNQSMNTPVSWKSFPVFSFRLAQYSSRFLLPLQWPDSIRDRLENLFLLYTREEKLFQQFQDHEHLIDSTSWAELSRWLDHAHLRKEVHVPYILSDYDSLNRIVHQLIEIRHHFRECYHELCLLIQNDFLRQWKAGVSLLSDPTLQIMLSFSSWDFRSALENVLERPAGIPAKKRHAFLQALHNYLARGIVKTCPFGLFCGTAIASFAENTMDSPVQIIPGVYAHIEPGRALLERLLSLLFETLPLEQLGSVHFDVSASLENEKLLFWRTYQDSGTFVEQLQAIKLDPLLTSVCAACGDGTILASHLLDNLCQAHPDWSRLTLRTALHRLFALHLLCPDTQVTAFSQNVLQQTLNILQDLTPKLSGQQSHWLEIISTIVEQSEPFSHQLDFHPTNRKHFSALLTTLQTTGKALLSDTRFPGTVLSVDSYSQVDGHVSQSIRLAIEHAASLSFLLAGAAYPDSQECANREQFLAAFRASHGDDRPVSALETLKTHWESLEAILARVMRADYQRISPESTLTWPQPQDPSSPYGRLYQHMITHLTASQDQHHQALYLNADLLRELADKQPRRSLLVDAVCRVAVSPDLPLDHRPGVSIEAVTLPGRLTARHWRTLTQLGEQEAHLVESYQSFLKNNQTISFDTEVIPVEVIATPFSPKDQQIDRRSEKPSRILALTEPIQLADFQQVLRFKDLYFRYDTQAGRIKTTLGPDGPEIALSYTSPLSPSYNRRLHLLRYVALMSYPVLVAPRWFLPEASQRCHLPRLTLDNLVLTPERWVLPAQEILSVLRSRHKVQRYLDFHLWRKRQGLPERCFVYTNRQTKPLFVDFSGPWGFQNVFGLLSQQAETLLFEECYPDAHQQLLSRAEEPVFHSIVVTLKQEKSAEEMKGDIS